MSRIIYIHHLTILSILFILLIAMKSNKGFTMIELIVVIALMGILATIGFSAYSTSMQAGRDNRRKLDLKNIASALQMYYADHGIYPKPVSSAYDTIQNIMPTISPYMKQVPDDPKFVYNTTTKKGYVYRPLSDGQCYCMAATVERNVAAEDQSNNDCPTTWFPITPTTCVTDNAGCYPHFFITCP